MPKPSNSSLAQVQANAQAQTQQAINVANAAISQGQRAVQQAALKGNCSVSASSNAGGCNSLEAMGEYLAAHSGLCLSVAVAWVTAENGENNDILGVTKVGGGFPSFGTCEEGLDAAIATFTTNDAAGYYAGIRAAIASCNCCAQRTAIIGSPWCGGHYNNGADFPSVAGCE